jgi:hypothetical protein
MRDVVKHYHNTDFVANRLAHFFQGTTKEPKKPSDDGYYALQFTEKPFAPVEVAGLFAWYLFNHPDTHLIKSATALREYGEKFRNLKDYDGRLRTGQRIIEQHIRPPEPDADTPEPPRQLNPEEQKERDQFWEDLANNFDPHYRPPKEETDAS